MFAVQRAGGEADWYLTARGERIMVPQYGCNMDELVFENLDTRMRTLMADKIESATVPAGWCDGRPGSS